MKLLGRDLRNVLRYIHTNFKEFLHTTNKFIFDLSKLPATVISKINMSRLLTDIGNFDFVKSKFDKTESCVFLELCCFSSCNLKDELELYLRKY